MCAPVVGRGASLEREVSLLKVISGGLWKLVSAKAKKAGIRHAAIANVNNPLSESRGGRAENNFVGSTSRIWEVWSWRIGVSSSRRIKPIVGHVIGSAPIAQVVKDQHVIVREMLEVIKPKKRVRDDHRLRAFPNLWKNSRTPSSGVT
jgi:hypothetical protein